MFVRIHSFKFQNEFAKNSIKQNLKFIALDFFQQGLLTQCFVDVDETSLYMINTWLNENASNKVFKKFKINVFEQVKEMGVKISISGGPSEVRFCDPQLLDEFTKVSK